MAPRQPPELMAEVVEEILLRVPPDDPARLAHASLVCRLWRRLLSDPAFGRRYRGFHRAPPLLGFLHEYMVACVGNVTRFVPAVTPCPFPQRTFLDCRGWRILDCRHGRVIFENPDEGGNLVVWDSTTGKRQRLPEPPVELGAYNAAVLCAVRGCDHLDCRGGPFFVVFVGYNKVLCSHLYSSEAGAWIASSHLEGFHFPTGKRSMIIGDDIYFVIIPRDTILKYSLGRNCLSIINPPEEHDIDGGIALMPMNDNSLGISGVLCSKLCQWSRIAEVWVQFRVIELEPALIPFRRSSSIMVVGSAEGLGIIFVTTDVGVFTLELKSGQVRKVAKPSLLRYIVFPFLSFYTPDCVSSALPSSPAEAH